MDIIIGDGGVITEELIGGGDLGVGGITQVVAADG